MKPKNRAILETERAGDLQSPSLIGSRVTHRNAPERIGVIESELNGQCIVAYLHEAEAGQSFTTRASYPLADLTIVPR